MEKRIAGFGNYDTNTCMNTSTRERLVEAASELFAERGYVGASVRDICNLARANPGAISYHFGGKRQLYRSVLRNAAAKLALAGAPPEGDGESDEVVDILQVARSLFRRLDSDPVAVRLLLRDLADGGSLAVEALEPGIRNALDVLQTVYGSSDAPRASAETGLLFLQLAAPVFMLAAIWPAVARPLELGGVDREALLHELTRRALPQDRGGG